MSERTPEMVHNGFDRHGKLIWSETPIDNEATRWVKGMCRRIPNEYLSPAMVIDSLRDESHEIQALLSFEVIRNWSTIDRFHLWPTAWAPSTIARVLMDHGKGRPMWLADPWKWAQLCNGAEARHGYGSRFGAHPDAPSKLFDETSFS